jgi:hypothetical protein
VVPHVPQLLADAGDGLVAVPWREHAQLRYNLRASNPENTVAVGAGGADAIDGRDAKRARRLISAAVEGGGSDDDGAAPPQPPRCVIS